MLYKPNYCCHCGEAIDRLNQKWTDSSQFCDICQYDFVGRRVFPPLVVAATLIFGLAGIAGFLRPAPPVVNVERRGAVVTPQQAVLPRVTPPPQNTVANQSAKVPAGDGNVAPHDLKTRREASPDEPPAMCGAMTKKGTTCTRRVKGGGRCWQHRSENQAREQLE